MSGGPAVAEGHPKDDTPGCTKQACAIRDGDDAFLERRAVVLGVSPDDEASHARFKETYGLPFTLLADPDHALAEADGVRVQKERDGVRSMGVDRSTFLIDANGTVTTVLRDVDPATHAGDVLAALDAGG